jgi:hypothetical protein
MKLCAVVACALVSACVTYPYETGFAACDRAAGQCYRGCDVSYGGPNFDRCLSDCDFSANRCFDAAYDPYRSTYGYGYGSAWQGSYGYWYPQSGYVFSYNNFGRDRYVAPGYRDRDIYRSRTAPGPRSPQGGYDRDRPPGPRGNGGPRGDDDWRRPPGRRGPPTDGMSQGQQEPSDQGYRRGPRGAGGPSSGSGMPQGNDTPPLSGGSADSYAPPPPPPDGPRPRGGNPGSRTQGQPTSSGYQAPAPPESQDGPRQQSGPRSDLGETHPD